MNRPPHDVAESPDFGEDLLGEDKLERLVQSLGPHFDHIESEHAALTAFRGKPAGNIRITTGEHAAHLILSPFVWYGYKVHAGEQIEEFAGEVREISDAGNRIEQLPGFGLGDRNEICHRLRRDRRMDNYDQRRRCSARGGCELTD